MQLNHQYQFHLDSAIHLLKLVKKNLNKLYEPSPQASAQAVPTEFSITYAFVLIEQFLIQLIAPAVVLSNLYGASQAALHVTVSSVLYSIFVPAAH